MTLQTVYPFIDLAKVIKGLVGDVAVVSGWPSTRFALPAVVVHPVERISTANCHADWTLSVDVVQALTDDAQALHELVEDIVPNLGVGYHADTTTYTQRSVGGVDVVVAATTVTCKR